MASEKVYDLIIIGAGPGGLMAATEASRYGLTFLLLEKNDRPGKKLLITGSGQCNLTHVEPIKVFVSHYHEKARFAGKVIRKFPPLELMKWFEMQGVQMEVSEHGKVFPKSRRASDILNALIARIHLSDECILCGVSVKSIVKKNDGFSVMSENKKWISRNVLIATGGRSYPSLGTTGDGYRLAEKMGHQIVETRPALTALEIKRFSLGKLAGISLENVPLSLWRDGKKAGEFQGDLLITHDGISGPVILNHARYFQSDDMLTLNMSKRGSQEVYAKQLQQLVELSGKKTVRSIIKQDGVPQRLIDTILELAGISANLMCGNLTRDQRKELVKFMTSFPFEIRQVKGYDTAMATAGGVATKDVVGSSMSSCLVEGLYFAGEVLDVDGMTGGYNLQFAFSSGFTAVADIRKKMKGRGSNHG